MNASRTYKPQQSSMWRKRNRCYITPPTYSRPPRCLRWDTRLTRDLSSVAYLRTRSKITIPRLHFSHVSKKESRIIQYVQSTLAIYMHHVTSLAKKNRREREAPAGKLDMWVQAHTTCRTATIQPSLCGATVAVFGPCVLPRDGGGCRLELWDCDA